MPPISTHATRRAFSTTTWRLIVTPESPKFIEVPTVKLPRPFKPGRKKGVLPEPKNLFPATQPDKGTPEYIAAATPEPTRPRHIPTDSETRAFQEWKGVMATKRRQNLREGLVALKQQKETRKTRQDELNRRRNEERNAALFKAEREDVRLTLPTVLSTLRHDPKVLQDPNREERLAAARAKREEILEHKKEQRRELVHELYMNAGKFILTESQLDAAIEEAFQEDRYTGDLAGKQQSVQDMLAEKRRGARSNMMGLFRDRGINDVAGALTGGRLPETGRRM